MGYKVTNNAFSTLASSLSNVALSLTVATGHGDRFPVITGADYTYITLEDAAGNIEIVRVTARATTSDVMTIVRAQDGTTARNWAAGDIVELRIIALLMDQALAHVDDTSAAHAASSIGVTPVGALVATNVQTALQELDADLTVVVNNLTTASNNHAAHLSDTVDAHDASAISYQGGTGIVATDVEGALDELANEKFDKTGGTVTGDIIVPEEVYGAGWNSSLEVPTKNAIYDKIESLVYPDKIQPITASVAASALTLTINPTVLDFRSSTLTSGTVNTRTISSAISMTVSSGSTLGTTSAVQSRIAVLAIDNAGTIEVACVNVIGGVDLSETGLISTTAEGGAGAADSAKVIYSTTARTNVPYRVVGYVESTQATAGTWATTPSTIQGMGGNVEIKPRSMVRVVSANGYGSTNTCIPRFLTEVTNQGTDITYADSTTLGASFTINTSGVYAISFTGRPTVANSGFGVSLNSNQLTTSILSITVANRLAVSQAYFANAVSCAAITLYLSSGDVIRPHTDSNTFSADPLFTIVRVG